MRTLDEEQAQAQDQLSHNAFEYIKTMAPWMKLVGIAGIVMSSMYVLVGMFTMVSSQFAVGLGIAIAGILYILFTLLILQSGINFSAYAKEKNILKLERALRKQRLFWIISGSLIIFIILMLILAVVFGGLSYFSNYGARL